MKKTLYPALLLFAMASSFLVGSWYSGRDGKVSGADARRILYYHDPMHPAYKSDKPGIAPDCGMQLEPVYADESDWTQTPKVSSTLPAGALNINPDRQQIIGVRISRVEIAPAEIALRALGRVAVDEARTVRMTAADGYIEKISPIAAGSVVRKGDLLATFYSKEFLAAQTSYFYANKTRGQLPPGFENNITYAQYQTAEKELRTLGMSEYQIQEISRTQKAATEIDLRAPMDGFVLSRNVTLGMRFDRSTELYRIADLSHVWIMADLFESEAHYFQPGMEAKIFMPNQGKALRSRVSNVLPQFDPASRVLKVRLETDNPGYALRPDMFVDVEFALHRPPSMVVPTEAVVDSGLQKKVYVETGSGVFEPRTVETGFKVGDRVEIVRGLTEGERIVVSGNFLMDSESRMRKAAASVGSTENRDPVCGMKVDPSGAGILKSDFCGKTFYFCSDHCKGLFAKNPEQYADPLSGLDRSHVRVGPSDQKVNDLRF
jgi:Cu(I)/Ag(I) efflux system membrane fusion protein